MASNKPKSLAEDVQQACECMDFVRSSLLAANRKASPTESIVILPLIAQAYALANAIGVLQQAIREEATL